MEPALGLVLFWLAFAGTHIGLSTRRLRAALVAQLGEGGFFALFSLVAAVTFAALVRHLALYRFAGVAGPGLGEAGGVPRLLLSTIVVSGLVLALASLGSYPRSPYALGRRTTREPYGLERVTRHPFFAGLAVAGAAHALLATRLVGCLFFAILAAYSLVGAWHQDRRLLAERGEPHARYLAATSLVPLAAVLAGRQRIVWRELPWGSIAVSAVAVGGIRLVHDSLLAANGAWLVGIVLAGAAVAALPNLVRSLRRRAVRVAS
jgi:uncharacterized membrane protein